MSKSGATVCTPLKSVDASPLSHSLLTPSVAGFYRWSVVGMRTNVYKHEQWTLYASNTDPPTTTLDQCPQGYWPPNIGYWNHRPTSQFC